MNETLAGMREGIGRLVNATVKRARTQAVEFLRFVRGLPEQLSRIELPSVARMQSLFANIVAILRRSPSYVLFAEALAIVSLLDWLYSDYRNNQFQQGYLQQLQISAGTEISIAAVVVAVALPLVLWMVKDRQKRVRIAGVSGAVLIAVLLSLSYTEYEENAFLRAYTTSHTGQIAGAFLGVAVFYVAAVMLTRAGLTRALVTRMHRNDLLVLIGYVVLTIGFTYPVILHMTDSVPQISRDVWHNLWDIWWVGQSITSFHSPFQVNIILYPTGTNAIFHTFTFVNTLLGIPLQSLFGLVATFNLLFLSSYVLSGITMYVLSKYLTKDAMASFIAGLVYAFFPQHVVQSLAHLNIMTQQWLPLYALFLIKMVKERSMRNGIYSGIALTLVAFSDLHFLYMAVVLTLTLLIYSLWKDHSMILNRRFLQKMGLMVAVFVLLALPYLIEALPYLFSQGRQFSQAPLVAVERNSADLTTYFVPGSKSAIFNLVNGVLPPPPYSLPAFSSLANISNLDHYVGFTVLLLAVFAVLISLRKKQSMVPFWAILAIVAGIISLGPFLIVSGKVTGIELPYYFLYVYGFRFSPFSALRSFRAVSRFDILVMLSVSVLVAFAMKDITQRLRNRDMQRKLAEFRPRHSLVDGGRLLAFLHADRRRIFAALIITLILFEFSYAPLPLRQVSVPTYYNVIRQDPGDFVVLEVPIQLSGQSYLYYQTFHGHTIVDGRVSRNPAYALVFSKTTPFIRTLQLSWPTYAGPLVQKVNETDIAPYVLGEYNIKYIVVHRFVLDLNVARGVSPPFTRASEIISSLSAMIGPPIYNGTDAALFRFDNNSHLNLAKYLARSNTTATNSFLMLLQGNWDALNSLSSNASLEIISAHNMTASLNITLQGVGIPRVMEVQIGADPPTRYLVGSGSLVTFITSPLMLKAGPNVITFDSIQACSAISPTNPSCESFQFSSIGISRASLIG